MPAAKIGWPVDERALLAGLDLRDESFCNRPELSRHPLALLDGPIRDEIGKMRSASLDKSIQSVAARSRQSAFYVNVSLDQVAIMELSFRRREEFRWKSIPLREIRMIQ